MLHKHQYETHWNITILGLYKQSRKDENNFKPCTWNSFSKPNILVLGSLTASLEATPGNLTADTTVIPHCRYMAIHSYTSRYWNCQNTHHTRSNSVSTTQRYETQFFLKILTLTVVLSNYKYFKVHSQWKYLFSSCDIWYEIAYQGSNHIFSKLSEIENSTVHIYMALCLQLLQAVIHRDEHSSLTPSTSEKSEIYSYFTNYHLCNVQNMKSKFIVMCRTSKNTQFIIKFSLIINVYWS